MGKDVYLAHERPGWVILYSPYSAWNIPTASCNWELMFDQLHAKRCRRVKNRDQLFSCIVIIIYLIFEGFRELCESGSLSLMSQLTSL
ncbi:hypothetical protein BDV19DRAFT_352553 [Aspergillus venezuelensis]